LIGPKNAGCAGAESGDGELFGIETPAFFAFDIRDFRVEEMEDADLVFDFFDFAATECSFGYFDEVLPFGIFMLESFTDELFPELIFLGCFIVRIFATRATFVDILLRHLGKSLHLPLRG